MARSASRRNDSGAFDVLVRGDGLAAVLAATDFARIGLRTALVPAGGDVTPDQREYASAWGGVVAGVCDELGVGSRLEQPQPGEECILGIPGSPLSPSTREVLGASGAMRVYRDRLTPLLAIGEQHNLATLVRSRLGGRALDALVRPAVRAELCCTPEEVDVRDVAPGLLQAMSRVGSLTLGVLEMAAADSSTVARVYPVGGIGELVRSADAQADYFAVHRSLTAEALIGDSVTAHVQLDLAAPIFRQALHVAIPRARSESLELRRTLLSDPDYVPIGPVDLER